MFLLGEMRLELGAQLPDGVADGGQLGVAGPVHGRDLVGQRVDAGQLAPQVGVVRGLEVVDQLGGAHRGPLVRAGVRSGRLGERGGDRGGVETLAAAGVLE